MGLLVLADGLRLRIVADRAPLSPASVGIGPAAHQRAFWSDAVQRGLHFLGFVLHSDPQKCQKAQCRVVL
jgi:hypothetical protein